MSFIYRYRSLFLASAVLGLLALSPHAAEAQGRRSGRGPAVHRMPMPRTSPSRRSTSPRTIMHSNYPLPRCAKQHVRLAPRAPLRGLRLLTHRARG